MKQNNHYWGDNWNGEDLSIFSLEDKPLPLHPHSNEEEPGPLSRSTSVISNDPSSPSYSQSRSTDASPATPENLQRNLKTPSISSEQRLHPHHHDHEHEHQHHDHPAEENPSPGFRAAEAYVRPSPIATVGSLKSYGFDLRNAVFTMSLDSTIPAEEDKPTEIFLPDFHFPREHTEVEVSSGKWTISVDDEDRGLLQRLQWVHPAGEHKITVKGVRRRQGMALGKEEEEGYMEQCKQSTGCNIM